MTDPITHENTVAEIDDLRARLDAALRENASLRAEHDVALAEIGVDHTREIQEIRQEYGAAIAALERSNAALVKAVEEELNWQTELADEAGRAGNPFADNRSQAIRDCVRDIRAALAAVEAAGKGVNNAE